MINKIFVLLASVLFVVLAYCLGLRVGQERVGRASCVAVVSDIIPRNDGAMDLLLIKPVLRDNPFFKNETKVSVLEYYHIGRFAERKLVKNLHEGGVYLFYFSSHMEDGALVVRNIIDLEPQPSQRGQADVR